MSEPHDVIDRATRALREPVATDPEAKRRLIEAVRQAPPPRVAPTRRAWRWLAQPRPIMVSPLAGASLAAVLALVVVLRPLGDDAATPVRSAAAGPDTTAASTTAPSAAQVQFVFVAPAAASVSIVGDFNGWDPAATPLRARGGSGVWEVDVPLTPGRHVYSFIVDGRQWHPDPLAPRAPESDVDAPSSVVLVSGRSS